MGKTPQNLIYNIPYRWNTRRPIYVSMAELMNWAWNITQNTEEGEPYHDAYALWQDALEYATGLFDGSMTFTDPITGETKNVPAFLYGDDNIGAWEELELYFSQDYNCRLMNKPLFSYSYDYVPDNDGQWYKILQWTCSRIKRYCDREWLRFFKQMRAIALDYNPIADYWSKSKELGGSSPYASFGGSQTDPEDVKISDWTTSNGKAAYKSESDIKAGGIETDNYTTTYEDASSGRLAGKSIQTGGTQNTSEVPNSAYWKKREEEGNKGSFSPQEMIAKELELAPLASILDEFLDGLSKEIFLQVWNGA